MSFWQSYVRILKSNEPGGMNSEEKPIEVNNVDDDEEEEDENEEKDKGKDEDTEQDQEQEQEDEEDDDGEPLPKKSRPNEAYRNVSEGTITFRVANVSKELTFDKPTVFSPVEYINNIPWKIGVKCMPNRKLAVYLYLEISEVGKDVEVYTEYNFSLTNQVNSLKTITKPPRYDVIKAGTAFGDTSFIAMEEMLHSYNNYVVDDQVVIEVYLTCGALVSSKQKSDFLGNIAQREKEVRSYMHSRVDYFISKGIGSDCELVFIKNGEKIVKKACKAILARVSPVFEKMFFGEAAAKGDRFNITNVEEDIFDALLLHAYGGKLDFKSKDRAIALYLASCAYEMRELQHICMEYTWPRVLGDVWLFLYMSDIAELEHMKAAAVRVFARYASEGFVSEQFQHISYESLANILSQVALNMRSELDVFDGVVRWAKAQCTKQKLEETHDNLRSVAKEAIYMIRFLSMTHAEFEASPMLSSILSAEEKISILTRIIYKKKSTSLGRLCCLLKPRLRL